MNISPIIGWALAYLAPVLVVFAIIGIFLRKRSGTPARMAVVHAGLFISTLISQYFLFLEGRTFPLDTSIVSVSILVLVVIIITTFLGRFGFLYSLSAFIQQATLLSIAYYLSPALGFGTIVVLLVPLYAVSHLLEMKYWHIKILATLAWGIISLALFFFKYDLLLNTALHALLGSVLIYSGIMYPRSDFVIKRFLSKNKT